jgi:hypothetical protein
VLSNTKIACVLPTRSKRYTQATFIRHQHCSQTKIRSARASQLVVSQIESRNYTMKFAFALAALTGSAAAFSGSS